ncbi:hypothetical protein M5689_001862 [Euphorbia peplus]|nr:hypothetical protein M5689_001862 [Euphorbia peplus]
MVKEAEKYKAEDKEVKKKAAARNAMEMNPDQYGGVIGEDVLSGDAGVMDVDVCSGSTSDEIFTTAKEFYANYHP